MTMSRIIVDAFGGDNAPACCIQGALLARQKWGMDVAVVGDAQAIRSCAAKEGLSLDDIEIIGANGVIEMCDDPGEILKSKKDCSMAEGLRRVAAGDGDAFVSAGSTGALVMGSTFYIKRIQGIKRAALAVSVPTPKQPYLLIDSGANVECRPEMLQSFGIMGSVYMERVMGVTSPRVGLLNVGTEESKGGELQHMAFALLKASPLNFIGNVEARDVPGGGCDVLVCDGFSGNVVLKLTEGAASSLMGMIKGVFLSGTAGKRAALLVKKKMSALKRTLDYREAGGAPLMGVRRPVIKAHGSSDAKAIMNAIHQAAVFAESNAIDAITRAVAQAAQERREAQ